MFMNDHSNWVRFKFFVGSSLVDMYAKCGTIENAWRMFNKMLIQNVITWTAKIWANVKCGQG
jgi:pentatricopeptide repeat protein